MSIASNIPEIAKVGAAGKIPARNSLTYLRMKYLCIREYKPNLDSHTWHEIIYIARGRYFAETSDGTLVADETQYIYYPPGTLHRPVEFEGESPVIYVLVWEEPSSPDFADRQRLMKDNTGHMLMILRWMWSFDPPQDAHTRDILQSLLHLALLEFISASTPVVSSSIESAIKHMYDYMDEGITLDDIANVCGMSKFQLIRLFKRTMHTTPMQYLHALRQDTAITMILNSTLPINTISARVGIANPFHLSRMVKIKTGYAPRELRRRAQQG